MPFRFVLADTEHLHEKIRVMSQRIRQLEEGLAAMQAAVSKERHPLLSDELLKIKFGAEASGSSGSRSSYTEDDDYDYDHHGRDISQGSSPSTIGSDDSPTSNLFSTGYSRHGSFDTAMGPGNPQNWGRQGPPFADYSRMDDTPMGTPQPSYGQPSYGGVPAISRTNVLPGLSRRGSASPWHGMPAPTEGDMYGSAQMTHISQQGNRNRPPFGSYDYPGAPPNQVQYQGYQGGNPSHSMYQPQAASSSQYSTRTGSSASSYRPPPGTNYERRYSESG
jgi:hypothetical protein